MLSSSNVIYCMFDFNIEVTKTGAKCLFIQIYSYIIYTTRRKYNLVYRKRTVLGIKLILHAVKISIAFAI